MQNEKGWKAEIEGIIEESDFLLKSEFIRKMREAESDNPDKNPDTVEEMQRMFADEERMGDFWEFGRNTKWFFQSLEKIEKEHSGHIVFISNQTIIFSSEDEKEIKEKIRFLQSGIECNRFYAGYVPKPGENISKPKRVQ